MKRKKGSLFGSLTDRKKVQQWAKNLGIQNPTREEFEELVQEAAERFNMPEALKPSVSGNRHPLLNWLEEVVYPRKQKRASKNNVLRSVVLRYDEDENTWVMDYVDPRSNVQVEGVPLWPSSSYDKKQYALLQRAKEVAAKDGMFLPPRINISLSNGLSVKTVPIGLTAAKRPVTDLSEKDVKKMSNKMFYKTVDEVVTQILKLERQLEDLRKTYKILEKTRLGSLLEEYQDVVLEFDHVVMGLGTEEGPRVNYKALLDALLEAKPRLAKLVEELKEAQLASAKKPRRKRFKHLKENEPKAWKEFEHKKLGQRMQEVSDIEEKRLERLLERHIKALKDLMASIQQAAMQKAAQYLVLRANSGLTIVTTSDKWPSEKVARRVLEAAFWQKTKHTASTTKFYIKQANASSLPKQVRERLHKARIVSFTK